MLLLALSCLQGRPMRAAFDELAALADGVQLTPGNHPTTDFARHAAARPTRAHHGFAWDARRRPVWDDATGACLVTADSVHPPRAGTAAAAHFDAALAAGLAPALETMYPGYRLGSGDELDAAMRAGVRLAVDVSHAFMQMSQGALDAPTWQRLMDYDRIDEIHVSRSDGRSDLHAPLTADTFGLAWAHARAAAGTPLVLESYFHRLPADDRRRQVELARGAA